MDEKLEEMEKQIKEFKKREEESSKRIADQSQKLKEAQNEKKELQQQNQVLNDKLIALSSPKQTRSIEHSDEFWTNIRNNCFRKTGPFGTDSIKTMIKTGKMTIYDTQGRRMKTLLHIAVNYGAYDLVQFLIIKQCL